MIQFLLYLVRAAFNPATLITAGAPLLIVSSEGLFRARFGSHAYTRLMQAPDVCALLDHRTQMYTVLVAFGFYVIQTYLFLGAFRTAHDYFIPSSLIRERPIYVLYLLVAIVIIVLCMKYILQGSFMTAEIIEMHKYSEACQTGDVVGGQFPPWRSPVTWFRIIIGVAAVAGEVCAFYHEDRNVEKK